MTITWDPDSERGVDQAGRNSSHSTCIVKFRAAKESLVTEGKSFNERIRVAKELCAVLREIARGENQEQHSTAISDIVALISRELTAGNAAIASHLIKGLASLGASVCQDLICTALLDLSLIHI